MTTKTLNIKGMMCAHCQKHVTDALNQIPGVTAEVNHEEGTARVSEASPVDEAIYRAAIEDAGYELISIE